MRPGPGLVVMALAFISGARRGSTSTSQQKISSLTSPLSSSSLLSFSSSSSPKASLLLSPTSEYHYYQHEQPPEQRTRSNRYPPNSSSASSSFTSSSLSSSSISSESSSSALSSSYSLFHSLGSSGTSAISQIPSSSSLSSDYRKTFTIYNYDRNTDEFDHKFHFDNFKLDKISYVNVEDYGENTEEIGVIERGGGGFNWKEDATEYDDRENSFFSSGVHSHSHIFESTSSLSRVNPWLSACDLAQPSSAPDLQGQCTAGSLPVAWVDEGPGPPTCPMSCEQLNLDTNSNYNSNTYSYNNKLLNYDNNYLINLNNNNNFNPVHNIMSKVRRETGGFHVKSAALSSANAKMSTISPMNAAAARSAAAVSSQITTIKPPGVVERTTTTVSTASINANKMVADKTVETRSKHQHQDTQSDAQSSAQDHHYNYNNLDNYNNIVKNNLNNRKNVNNYNIKNDNSNQFNQNQQQQQCLDYLGDNDDSSPTQLCKNSRSDLEKKLRTLRLKHCCERTVLSALHTIALNVTLEGGPQCVRILTDILDLDILATRITCELAEILFRYDCRQIYSLIHQCKDCKEAYRRWVCSTLVPFFAEHRSTSTKDSTTTTVKTEATSNSTKYKTNNKQPKASNDISLNDENDENFDRDKFHPESLSIYDEDESIESPHISKLSSPALSMAQLTSAAIGQQLQKHQRSKEHSHLLTKRSEANRCKQTKSNSKMTKNVDERESSSASQIEVEDSISTANNKDPCVEGPVITRLLIRTKRKVEFRKRRRIRPCLSVCQTVEQKCPYLLPGDRAPAYPTQYAGEPTFLCLDQNIPETGEQLLKSNHGPPECCYRYCDQPAHGICIYCDDFDDGSGTISNTTAANNYPRDTNTPFEERLAPSSPAQDTLSDLRLSKKQLNSIKKNTTTVTSIAELDKLPYYAYSGLVYYYDDVTDLPNDPVAECQPVASVTSRCTMPYYASSATSLDAASFVSQRYKLIWSSIICFLVQNNILLTVHIPNDSNYRFYYYCCYNLNDWWRRLIVLVLIFISL